MNGNQRVSLREIFKVFFYIGVTGFGGGMAIVSLTERVCVHEKKWLGQDEFLHGIAFGQILGPFSLNITTFVGSYLRGTVGGIVAATAFVFPSFCLITFMSWLYFRYHQLPQLQSALRGTNPVIIALILVAAIGMTRSKVKGKAAWLMAVGAFSASAFFDVSALTILILACAWSLARAFYSREHA